MLVVVALGGNALLRRGEQPTQEAQRRNVERAAKAVAGIARNHRTVVTHGNGPQVGLLALREAAYRAESPDPLDVLGSETQGMLGYLIEEALRRELPGVEVATLLTQVVIDPRDPAFASPTKPIGPIYSAADAQLVARERGWIVAAERDGYRRVVASPEPQRILELRAIQLLVAGGVTVICGGGGGIPVVVTPAGAIYGVEAVVDKDFTAALLATALKADALLLLTNVAAVETDWGTPQARQLRTATPEALRALHFAPGSMGPKVEAACRFAERTGGRAVIGALEDAVALLDGRAGTTITAGAAGLDWWPAAPAPVTSAHA